MKKVAIVTGASRGLGLEISRQLIGKGHVVFGLSRTQKYWKKASQEIPSNRFILCHGDLTKESFVKKFVAGVKKTAGRIDLVINNAGYGGELATVDKLSVKELTKHLEQNLLSVFLVCKHAVPILRKQSKGLLVNVASMAGVRAVPNLFAYSASKFGILALSQCVAKENSDKNIRCVTICPGGINTKMRSDLFGKKDASRQQSAEFVAGVIQRVIDGKIKVESGGDIIIRHGKITSIRTCPGK